MRREESILPTYSGGNGQWRASSDGVAWLVFNDGGGGFQLCSGSRSSSGGGVGGRDSSSKQQLGGT
jgi:hypothetical protein